MADLWENLTPVERLKQQYLDWNARMLPRPATASLQ
jgi:hypothetical protein